MEKYRDFTAKELKWIDELEKVMDKAPKRLFLFAGGGALVIYPERYMNEFGNVDGNAPSKSIRPACEIDGGDW